MTTDPNKMPHPVPRDADEASFSEMVPIKSTKINIFKSPIFWFLIATAALTIFSFNVLTGFEQAKDLQTRASMFTSFALFVAIYLLLVALLAVFLYSKTDKPLWANFLNFAFVAALIATPIGMPYFIVFRNILPGGLAPSQDFVKHVVGMFFGAGLQEEFMKVTLVLIGAYMTYKAATWKKSLPEGLFNALRIRGPLDGLMMGVFGGAGFIIIETLFQYVPNIANTVMKQSGSDTFGFVMGLMLLFPRVIGGMVGHMAWAGITGYAIGLAVLRPGKNWWKIIGIGWLVSSTLHTVWNSDGHIPFGAWISALAGAAIFVACLLKARQMEQAAGRETDSYGSIVVEKPAPAPAPAPAAAPAPAPAPAPATAKAEAPIALAIGEFQIALSAGKSIDLGQEPALGGKGAGIVGEVTQHPTRPDVLGLKNTGTAEWTATLRDGSTTTIESGRNLRLAPGVKVTFGDLEADVVAL